MIATQTCKTILSTFQHNHDHVVLSLYLSTEGMTRAERVTHTKSLLDTEFHRNARIKDLSRIGEKVKDEVIQYVEYLESSPASLAVFVSFLPEEDSKKTEDMNIVVHGEPLPAPLEQNLVFVSDIPDVRHVSDALHRGQSALVLSLHRDEARVYHFENDTLDHIDTVPNSRLDLSDPNVEADDRSSMHGAGVGGQIQGLRGENFIMVLEGVI